MAGFISIHIENLIPATVYVLQESQDLMNWTDLMEVTASTTQPIQQPILTDRRFYRIQY